MNFSHTKLICFDFDGVIVNTFDIALSAHRMLVPEATEEEYRMLFSGNIFKELRASKKVVLTEEHKLKFDAHYSSKLKVLAPIEGMVQLMSQLAQQFSLTIVSSSYSHTISDFLKQHNIEGFKDILGADVHESKHEKLQDLLKKYKVSGSDTVFITDTLGDISEAREAHVPAIAVTWGYQSRELLQKGNPAAIVDTPEELAQLFLK